MKANKCFYNCWVGPADEDLRFYVDRRAFGFA